METVRYNLTKHFLTDIPGFLVFRGSPEGKISKVNAAEQGNIPVNELSCSGSNSVNNAEIQEIIGIQKIGDETKQVL